MSTHANIAIDNGTGTVTCTYVHFDGESVGNLLIEHYNSEEQARALVSLGAISYVAARLTPAEGEKHSFQNPAEDVTVAYRRDRGERSSYWPRTFSGTSSFSESRVYLWRGGRWLVKVGPRFVPYEPV